LAQKPGFHEELIQLTYLKPLKSLLHIYNKYCRYFTNTEYVTYL
jgi:hypothetical protein